MDSKIKKVIQSSILDYLRLKFPNNQFYPNGKTFQCPFCPETSQPSASLFPPDHVKLNCANPNHGDLGDVFTLVRKLEDGMKDYKDADIADYLTCLLDIKFIEEDSKLLKAYHDAKFSLFPLKPSNPANPSEGKMPVDGFMWKEKDYHDINVWKDWLGRGYGLALKLGKSSNVMAVDIDDPATYERVKHLLGDTLTQTTKRGSHYIYNYDKDFDHVNHRNFRDKKDSVNNYDMELRNNNAYIVVAPTSVEGEKRSWNNQKISDMPVELKEFLLKLCKKEKVVETADEEIQKVIQEGKLDVVDLSNRRNDTFVKLGGIFRKKLNVNQTQYVLNVISSSLIDKPIEQSELRAIMGQIKKYTTYDKEELMKIVLERLEIVKEGSAFQIAKSLSYEQKDIEEVLNYLETEGKIISIGKNRFKKLEEVEWVTGFEDDLNVPIDFQVPYFSDYAWFDWGNMVIIGGRTGTGKSHICANFIKKLSDQSNIDSIDLISTEAGSKIGKVLDTLRVPTKFICRPKQLYKHPSSIELRDGRITLIDWLRPKDGDFTEVDNTLNHFHEQLKKHRGFLIVFVQIRDSGKHFAPDQINNFATLSATYNFGNGGKDSVNTYFQTDKIRDSKSGLQYMTIPTFFDQQSKTLELRKQQ